jgi:uncharacterized lipoprotein YddW (UPF0748 family)
VCAPLGGTRGGGLVLQPLRYPAIGALIGALTLIGRPEASTRATSSEPLRALAAAPLSSDRSVHGDPGSTESAPSWPIYGPPAVDVPLVEVKVPREFRGLWVATVANLDFPTRPGLSDASLKLELSSLVNTASDLGFNALVFQVRPEGDALYESKLEPWSRVISGKQGRGPGFDPLKYLIAQSHARGLEVHAWFNPYRASSSRSAAVAANHVITWGKDFVRPWGSLMWADPGAPSIQEHAVNVVDDVLVRYDIDGIHLDDYFYPYPEAGRQFADDRTYQSYKNAGGKLSKDLWRRSNVDTLVRRLGELVRRKRPDVRFGISPFGIYRPGKPAGVRGLDQLVSLHADPLKWYREGWVDYLAPQLYWPTTAREQPYERLVAWWDDQVTKERPLLVGLDLTKVGKEPAWTLAELRKQVKLSRSQDQTAGQIWFRAAPVQKNQAGVAKLLNELYAAPALPPPLPRLRDAPAPPKIELEGHTLSVRASRKELKAFVLYRRVAQRWEPHVVLGPGTEALDMAPGTWALSAVSRSGAESLGARFVVGGT